MVRSVMVVVVMIVTVMIVTMVVMVVAMIVTVAVMIVAVMIVIGGGGRVGNWSGGGELVGVERLDGRVVNGEPGQMVTLG